MLIVGEREAQEGQVAVREHGKGEEAAFRYRNSLSGYTRLR